VGDDAPPAWTLREARIDELAEVGAALADAFVADPVLQWLAPSARTDRNLRRLLEVELEHCVLPAGRVLTPDGIPGASLELPPGRWEMVVPPSAALGFLRAFGPRLFRARRLQKLFEDVHPWEPHYYIRYLGVETRCQGQGLGTALLRETLDRCDRDGMPAYLEASTERSAALYARLGFVHLGELRVANGPRFWPMRRPPAAYRVAAAGSR
jgi:ribosomal protein S18 acetylase RimI-like enzyme